MLNDEIENRRIQEKFYEKDYYNADSNELRNFLNQSRALSLNQTRDLGFPYWEYPKIKERGYCLGRLDFKEWGSKMSLVSYFELSSGYFGRGKFTTYRNRDAKYKPTKGHLDLAETMIGDTFILKLECKEKGNSFIREIWQVDSKVEIEMILQKILNEN
ncbi:hypothetical protein GHI93_00195 [Lactococcus hircilactis]|uniref:Uncharacterized protein n=1 Tax=Lactococcus hircilactis TaxID=1494462 RepID=A0A7X1Z8E2_9LACT|nr:hypothetical protein [Lactococcus hircilactis]MQW38370.1 hypothetical protein [Lactococcus hircilactis]